MRHELAYILGQMQNRKACEVLSKILRDESDDVLVRHEVLRNIYVCSCVLLLS
jgi:deoxyhypusine monooxygenase